MTDILILGKVKGVENIKIMSSLKFKIKLKTVKP